MPTPPSQKNFPQGLLGLAVAAALLGAPCCRVADAAEADWLRADDFSPPEPMRLEKKSERLAQAIAMYLQAIFEEEDGGPDSSLDTKRKVLALDPAFHDLAIHVANQYLRRGQTAEALAILKDASKAAPKEIAPVLALASVYLRHLEKPDLAEKYALQALAAAPDEPGPYESLLEIYRAGGQSKKVEALFQQALKRKNAGAKFWLKMAEARTQDNAKNAGLPQTAVIDAIATFLERAVSSAGEDAPTLARAADYFVLCGRLERAASLYQSAIGLRPRLPGNREKLVACLLQTGDTTGAIKWLGEIVQENPLDVRAYDQLAELHCRAGDFPRALSNLRQALLLAPPDPRRYDSVINLCFHTNEGKAAIEAATDAEKKFPLLIEFTLYRAIALSDDKQHEEAIKAFEKTLVGAANTKPQLLDGTFYFAYGAAEEQAGHPAKAAELFFKSIAADPQKSAKACNYLGYMWAERNENLAEAEKLIRRALEMEPTNGSYLDSLGWVFFRQGKYPEALAELLRAAEAVPDPVVYEHIGDAYEKLGGVAEAVLYWQKALNLAPENLALTKKLDANSARVAGKPATPQTPAH